MLIKQDSIEANIRSFLKMTAAHHYEVWPYADRVSVDVDIDRYLQLEHRGNLVFVTVKEGLKLVGYYAGILNYCLHHSELLVCTTAFFYIDKQHRKGLTIIRLLNTVEKILRDKKVKQWDISYTTKKELAPIMKRIGAEKQEIVCRKWLGD